MIYESSILNFDLRILTDRKLPWSLDGICYGIVSFISFLTFTFLSYYYYAEEFLEHAHLHHLTRQDTRHNFSVSSIIPTPELRVGSSAQKTSLAQETIIFYPNHFRFGFFHFIYWMGSRRIVVCALFHNWPYLS